LPVTYTVSITNESPGAFNSLVMSDVLPATVTFISGSLSADNGSAIYSSGIISWTGVLSPGQRANVTYAALVSADTPPGIFVTNTATISGDGARDGMQASAAFWLDVYTLTVSKAGDSSGAVTSIPAGIDCGSDCSGAFTYGTLVTLTAVPDTGSTFAGWAGACSGAGECAVTMTGTLHVTATFILNTYTLTVSKAGDGSGNVATDYFGTLLLPGGTTYAHGTVVTLTATPNTGSTFAGWSGAVTTTTNPLVLTMDTDKTVTATFTLNPAATSTLTINTTGNGKGAVSVNPPGAIFAAGTIVTLTAVPSATSSFTGWSGAVTSIANPITLTMDANKEVTATFATYLNYLPIVLRD